MILNVRRKIRDADKIERWDMVIANEPAERRRSAGEAAENSAARRMLYAEKFPIDYESVSVRCKNSPLF